MAHISEHIGSSNHNIHSYDQMSKIIVKFGSKKWWYNDISTCQLTSLKSLLLIRIVDTPEKDFYHGEVKSVTNKVHTSLVYPY